MRSAHFLTILFATTLLIGCGPNVVDITRLANQDGTGYLFWDWDETIYYEGKPFTGLAEWVSEYFPEEIFSARLPFKKGKIDISAGWEAFYASGQIAVRCEEFLGKPKIPYECHNGRHEWWYMTGQMEIRANYKEGRRDGLYEAWHNNGQISERGNYKEGEEDGLHEKWHENGQLSKQFLYTPVDGRSYSHIITRASCWDENGDGDNSSCNYW